LAIIWENGNFSGDHWVGDRGKNVIENKTRRLHCQRKLRGKTKITRKKGRGREHGRTEKKKDLKFKLVLAGVRGRDEKI